MRSAICAVLTGLMIAGVAGAAPQKHWHEDDDHREKHWKHHDRDDDDDDRDEDGRPAGCYFGPRDVWIVSDYYAPRYRTLPPGLQKKLYRTGHLPPGWERKLELLPPVVERQLIVIPGSYRRGIIDGYIVIYEPRTHIVIDVAALFAPQ